MGLSLPGKHVESPSGQIQVEALVKEIVALPGIAGLMHQVLKRHLLSLHIHKGPGHVTLALAGAIINGNQEALARLAIPGEGQEAIRGGVPLPGLADFQELPAAKPYFGALQAGQEVP